MEEKEMYLYTLDEVEAKVREIKNMILENQSNHFILVQLEALSSSLEKLLDTQNKNVLGFIRSKWMRNYSLATKYYEHYGNLEIPKRFQTTNGYEYEEDGIKLGLWIVRLRQCYSKKLLSLEETQLLEKIGMAWEPLETSWMRNYNLAKKYYEYHGNLRIPQKFKTINGYEYDENGIELGKWLDVQSQKKQAGKTIDPKRLRLLEEIGMVWSKREFDWMQSYHLAQKYYEHYGDLNIKYDFITSNGYEYDKNGVKLGAWLANQKLAYQGKGTSTIGEYHISLLEEIGVNWFRESVNQKLQSEQIQEENERRKRKEVYHRFQSYLLQKVGEDSVSKEDINEGFLNHLNHKK